MLAKRGATQHRQMNLNLLVIILIYNKELGVCSDNWNISLLHYR